MALSAPAGNPGLSMEHGLKQSLIDSTAAQLGHHSCFLGQEVQVTQDPGVAF